MNDEEQIVAWIGVDWADEDHKVWKCNGGTGGKDNYAVPHSAESLQEWVRQLRELANCACRFCAWSKLYYQQQRARKQGSSCGRSCSRLQMDSHYVPMLEGSNALRRQPLREIANQARLASGKRLEPTTSGCCGNLSTVCESRA